MNRKNEKKKKYRTLANPLPNLTRFAEIVSASQIAQTIYTFSIFLCWMPAFLFPRLAPPICYLDPGPSVVLCSSPGVHQALLVEAGEVGVPFLQAKEGTVCGGGRDLLVGDDTPFHAQWSGTFCQGLTDTRQRHKQVRMTVSCTVQ